MIRVYYLPVQPTPDGEQVLGVDLIHQGILEGTEEPDVMKLVMDTTTSEHDQLEDMAVLVRDPTPEELDYFNAQSFPPTPEGFHPEDPVLGVEHRLAHVEDFLHLIFPS